MVTFSSFIIALPMIITMVILLLTIRPIEVYIFTLKSNLSLREKVFLSYIALKGLDPTILAIAVTVLVEGTAFIIPLVFGTIVFLTIIQSSIIWLLFIRKAHQV